MSRYCLPACSTTCHAPNAAVCGIDKLSFQLRRACAEMIRTRAPAFPHHQRGTMEIYNSSAEQTRTTSDTPIYRSRTRLFVGAFAWLLALAFFAMLAWRVQGKTGQLVFSLLLVAFSLAQVVRCLKYALGPQTPGLVFTQAGLQQSNGQLIPWNSIVENRYIDQSYLGGPVAKTIRLKVGQPAKPVLIPATALKLNGDQYLALCDRYQAAAN